MGVASWSRLRLSPELWLRRDRLEDSANPAKESKVVVFGAMGDFVKPPHSCRLETRLGGRLGRINHLDLDFHSIPAALHPTLSLFPPFRHTVNYSVKNTVTSIARPLSARYAQILDSPIKRSHIGASHGGPKHCNSRASLPRRALKVERWRHSVGRAERSESHLSVARPSSAAQPATVGLASSSRPTASP